jgi:hypothetical protein
MANKPNLHVSGLELLYKCGEAYYQRYVLGRKARPSVAAVIGSSTHQSVQANLQNKLSNNGAMLEVEHIKSIARDAIEDRWKGNSEDDEPALTKEERATGLIAVKRDSIDTTIKLSVLHRLDLAPIIHPTSVERPYVVNLDGYPYNLAGKTDIEECSGDVIRDTKTAAKTPSKEEAHDSEQLTMYALLKRVVHGKLPSRLYLDKLVKTKEVKVETRATIRTEDDIAMQMRRIERAIDVIERGAFAPTNPANWWCSEKWCGYWPQCPFAKRPVSVAIMNATYPTEQDLRQAIDHQRNQHGTNRSS